MTWECVCRASHDADFRGGGAGLGPFAGLLGPALPVLIGGCYLIPCITHQVASNDDDALAHSIPC